MPDVNSFWSMLEPKINALVTRRLIPFHGALVERGEIERFPTSPDPEETINQERPNHCSQDCIA